MAQARKHRASRSTRQYARAIDRSSQSKSPRLRRPLIGYESTVPARMRARCQPASRAAVRRTRRQRADSTADCDFACKGLLVEMLPSWPDLRPALKAFLEGRNSERVARREKTHIDGSDDIRCALRCATLGN